MPCCGVYAGDVSRPPGSASASTSSPSQQWPCSAAAAAVRMSCTTDLDSISPEHHGLSTAHPPGGSIVCPPSLTSPPSPSEILGVEVEIEKCPSDFRFRCYNCCEKEKGFAPVNEGVPNCVTRRRHLTKRLTLASFSRLLATDPIALKIISQGPTKGLETSLHNKEISPKFSFTKNRSVLLWCPNAVCPLNL